MAENLKTDDCGIIGRMRFTANFDEEGCKTVKNLAWLMKKECKR